MTIPFPFNTYDAEYSECDICGKMGGPIARIKKDFECVFCNTPVSAYICEACIDEIKQRFVEYRKRG